MSLREVICRLAVAVLITVAVLASILSNSELPHTGAEVPAIGARTGQTPGYPVRTDTRKVVTAHCVNYSAKCAFTLTPEDQKSFIAAGGGGSAVYLAASCGPTALGCLAAAAAVVAGLSAYLSENVQENCDLIVHTMPNPIGTGVIVKRFGHRCP